MRDSGFYRFGRMVGSKFKTAKWVWASAAGSEEEAIRAEYAVGRNLAELVRKEVPGGTDGNDQLFLDGISDRLVPVVRNKLHRFEVATLAKGQPSAFALPGGFIFVDRSLVSLCHHDRDEIAFVVAHEMAHVIRRHAINRLLSQAALSVVSLAAAGRGWLVPWLKKVGLQGLERAYSRDHEYEADALGVLITKAAGFDPAGSTRLLNRLGAIDQEAGQSVLGVYLSTHPSIEDRIVRLRDFG